MLSNVTHIYWLMSRAYHGHRKKDYDPTIETLLNDCAATESILGPDRKLLKRIQQLRVLIIKGRRRAKKQKGNIRQLRARKHHAG